MKLQAVFERVGMAVRSETVPWEGSEVDPCYMFKTETILDWLKVTPEEEREMFNLIGPDEKRRRNTESRREKRRAAGAQPRAESFQRRLTTAHLRDHLGLSTLEIAEVIGVSARTIRRWIK